MVQAQKNWPVYRSYINKGYNFTKTIIFVLKKYFNKVYAISEDTKIQ